MIFLKVSIDINTDLLIMRARYGFLNGILTFMGDVDLGIPWNNNAKYGIVKVSTIFQNDAYL